MSTKQRTMVIKTKKHRILARDKRGIITEIIGVKKTFQSILLITSKKDSVRANHYHKHETHYLYLIKGKFKYTEKPAGEINHPSTSKTIKAGEIVITYPNTIHAMKFLADSVMVVFTTRPRNKRKYEADLVRVPLIK